MNQTILANHTTRIVELLRYIAALQPQETHSDHIPLKDRLLDAGQAQRLPGVTFPAQSDPAEAWVRVARVQPTTPPIVPSELSAWVMVEDNPNKAPIEPKLRKRIDNPNRPAVKTAKTKTKKSEPSVEQLAEKNLVEKIELDDIGEASEGGAYVFLRNSPEIEQAYNEWMTQWNAWARQETLVREAAQVYQHLYQLFRDLSAEGPSETTEVVCGMGHVLWNIRDQESGKVVPYSYPLILQRCEVRLAEDEDFALELWPVGQAPVLHLGRLGEGNTKEAAEAFWVNKMPGKNDEPVSPFHPQSFSPIVSGLVARLDASGSYNNVGDHLPEPTERLSAFPWFTFFQKRRSHNNLLADLKRLEQAVTNAVALPEILINLVDRDSVHRLPDKLPVFRGVESFTVRQNDDAAQDLYFPLPYNEEQIQVVQRLEVSAGVVVQGPPGTGKSHTIANIVSHYLANGQRVLVTSHSAAALAAVREKIPDSIRDLSVALLTSETESLADFEKSVREIADRLATFNVNVSQRTIDDLMYTVNGLYKQLESLDIQIVEHMGVHHTTHNLQGQTVTLMDLVRFYAQHPEAPSWMGRVPEAQRRSSDCTDNGLVFPSLPSNLDEKLIQSIRQARLDAGIMFPSLFEPISDPSTWPRDKEIRSAISAQQRLDKLQKQLNDGLNKAQSKAMDPDAVWALTNDVGALGAALSELQNHQAAADALDVQVRSKAHADEPILLEGDDSTTNNGASAEFCNNIISLRNQLRQQLAVLYVPNDAVQNTEFFQAVERGANNGAPVGGFFQRMKADKSLKTWLDDVKVDGQRPNTTHAWQKVLDYLILLERAKEIPSSWGRYAAAFGWSSTENQDRVDQNKSLVISSPNTQDLFKQIDHIAKMAEFQLTRSHWRRSIAPAIEQSLAKIFVDPISTDASTNTKSKWARASDHNAFHLRAKPGRDEEKVEPMRITSPWADWDQKSEMEREAVLGVAERSLNLWQSIDQEQRFVDMFKENIQQLLQKSKPQAQLPVLPPLPIPPKTRQTVVAPVSSFMDKVQQFLEHDMWTTKDSDFGRRLRSMDSDPSDGRVSQWRGLLSNAERLYGIVTLAAQPAEHALTTLTQAGFGDWVHALLKNPLDNLPNPKRTSAALPDDPLLPENWKELVQQAQIHAFLSTLSEQQTLMGHFNTRRQLVQSLSTSLSELAAEKSWAKLALGVTPQQRQALGAYLSAVRSVGSGTGKRSARHQQDARYAMAEAFSAVPCWIMPTSKVSEVMPSELELFDLVIVDEASQSDLAALPALIRGKKILIVGDDKQVSPSNFVQEDLILQQRRTLLANQPFAPLMAPDRSIYDLFSGVLPNSSIMLREHFRCVAPIISWSNKNYYHNKMVPLRIPSGAERLDPPLIDIFVEDGKMEDDINEAEAIVIAREIQKIANDPTMKNKTIGVVTLPSKDAQSNKIRDAIDQAITQGAYINHKILVGPPARFQGSERDIMFVAMTWDGNSGGASDRPEFHQRFNVAMSRARDRMVLVRSIPDAALRSGTLLSKVVHHFHDDHSVQTVGGKDQCKTELERDIFQALSDQGYYVQAHIGPKHAQIDLVVEDKWGRRLAIECDGDIAASRLSGDSWHENWQSAVTNQRILERAGWTFLRVTAASWYLQPQQTLEKIVARLNELGVTPYEEGEQRDMPLVERKVVRAVVEPEPVVEPTKVSRFARVARVESPNN